MQDLINKFETMLTRDKVEKCKQVKITSYFVKKKKNLHCHTLIFFMFIGSFTQICLGLLGFLMISLSFLDLSGHSSTITQNLVISTFLPVQSCYLEVALSRTFCPVPSEF